MREFFTLLLLLAVFSASAAVRPFAYPIKVTTTESNYPLFQIVGSTNLYAYRSNLVEILVGTNVVFKVPSTNTSSGTLASLGVQYGSFTNQNANTFTNTFSTPYAAAPVVTVTCSATNGWPSIDLITTTGFAGSIVRTNLSTNYWSAFGRAHSTQ